MRSILLVALFLFSPISMADDAAIGDLFRSKNVTGTVVIRSLTHGTTHVWNDERSTKRFPSASTFKIFNTLIAVEERVFDPVNEKFVWDGARHDFADWDSDLSLPMAYRVSCVWCYQKLAERIGAARYLAHLRRAEYGEISIPFNESSFWLDGSFKVSAIDQVGFLEKLVTRSLPYSSASYEMLKSIMKEDTTPGYRIYAKTGWAARANPQLGWYVGYVETGRDVWLFALNMDVGSTDQLALRRKIALEALEAKGIIGKAPNG